MACASHCSDIAEPAQAFNYTGWTRQTNKQDLALLGGPRSPQRPGKSDFRSRGRRQFPGGERSEPLIYERSEFIFTPDTPSAARESPPGIPPESPRPAGIPDKETMHTPVRVQIYRLAWGPGCHPVSAAALGVAIPSVTPVRLRRLHHVSAPPLRRPRWVLARVEQNIKKIKKIKTLKTLNRFWLVLLR